MIDVSGGLSVHGVTEGSSVESKTGFAIDNRMSRFTVQAFAGGLLSALAHNPLIAIREFSGDICFEADSPERSSVVVRVNAASLEVSGNVNDRDRPEINRAMQEDVLESDRFADIVFESKSATVNRSGQGPFFVNLNGELTLHGVTRPLSLPATVMVMEDSLRANGTFSVKQTDYDIHLVTAVAGSVKVKDELKFSFDILARKKT